MDDRVDRRDMTPEEKFFFQNVGLVIHAAGRRNNAAFAAWDRLCGIMARNYDLTAIGGRSYMRKRRDLLKWMADQLQSQYAEYGQLLANRAGAMSGGGAGDPNLAAALEGGDV